MTLITHQGGCHCRSVRFRIQAPAEILVQRCNCSIYQMTGFEHLIVPAAHFELLTSPKDLDEYRFNSGVAKHLFCRQCGIKSFYVPRSNPDGYSINIRCLDTNPKRKVQYEEFDGRNWEENADMLSHLSKDSSHPQKS